MDPLAFISISTLLGIGLTLVLSRFRVPEVAAFFVASSLMAPIFRPDPTSLAHIFTLASILLAFEIGREVATRGFAAESLLILVAELAVVVPLVMIVGTFLGLSYRDVVALTLAFLSSSTPVVMTLSEGFPGDVRRVALTLSALEDSLIFIAMGALSGRDPIIAVVGGVVISVSIIYVLRLVISRIPRSYQLITSLAVGFGLSTTLQLIGLSPSLGAFVAGYVYGSVTRVAYTTAGELIFVLYAVTAPPTILLMQPTAISPSIMVALFLASLGAVLLRFAAVFLAVFAVTRRISFAAYTGVAMASISELAYLVVSVARPSNEVALVMAVLPVASMLVAPTIAPRVASLLLSVSKPVEAVVKPVKREAIDWVGMARVFAASSLLALSEQSMWVLLLPASATVIALDVSRIWDRSRGLGILVIVSASVLSIYISWLSGSPIFAAPIVTAVSGLLPVLVRRYLRKNSRG